eukprot:Skav235165  [mRNA]  locus=scaffold721:79456:94190:+ [translate_table: standard]
MTGCCGCSLEFGAYCILGLNLVRCLLCILIACDAVFLAGLSITGATFCVFAIYGVSKQMHQAVRLAWNNKRDALLGQRTGKDFHLEEGSEFFFQLKGNMELPTVQKGQRKLVKIKQGQIFCLPSREEIDGLIFYEDFNTCPLAERCRKVQQGAEGKKVRWEKFFRCEDLAKDLPPAYKAWEEAGAAPKEFKEDDRPVRQDKETEVPEPFSLQEGVRSAGHWWEIGTDGAALAAGARYFFVFQFVLDVCGVVWESLLHASCDDIPDIASGAACGIMRSLWIVILLMVMVIEGYSLFILHCYCEDVMVSLPAKPFEQLYSKAETHILAKHLNPYNHLYGALPRPDEIAGEAVMAGVPMESTYQIFNGTYHDLSFPPSNHH